MAKLVNRAKMTTATTGIGTLTLSSAVNGFQTFADAGVANGDTVTYVLEDNNDWEIGSGVYSSDTLTRVVSESSNSGSAINLSGTAEVYVTAAASSFNEKAIGTVTGNATLDLSTGTVFEYTPTANATFVFNNPPASGTGYEFDLKVTGNGIDTYYAVENAVYDNSFIVYFIDQPTTLVFNDDGTKVYVLNDSDEFLHQFSLSTAYDLSTASYDFKSFYFGAQYASGTSFRFNSDGTKVYILQGYTVYQYSLSTAYDISTASYDSVGFGFIFQGLAGRGIDFSADGTKMYYIETSNDRVHQYTLSTAWDLSTASYDSVYFSVAGQETNPAFVVFKSDGTKMYTGGSGSGTVHQYSLSTAYDLSTASYDSIGFNVSSQDSNPQSIAFNTDGTGLYVLGYNTKAAYKYTLSTGFDLSTASYSSLDLSLGGQDKFPTGVVFNADGTKMYIIGYSTDTVYQYSLSIAYDLSTASYDSVSFSVAGQEGFPTGIAFNPSGTKMYVNGLIADSVFQYSLSSGFDLSTASYDSVSFSVAGQDTNPTGMTFNTDGTKMFIVGTVGDKVYQYSLSTAFDLSTASYDSVSFSVATQDSYPVDITFNADGTKMYILGQTNDRIYQYSLSTAFDLSTASYDSASFDVSNQETAPWGITFNADGDSLLLIGQSSFFGSKTSTVTQYSWDGFSLFTLTYPASVSWLDASAPNDPADGEVLSLNFSTTDGGTTYYGSVVGDKGLSSNSTSGASQTVDWSNDIHVSAADASTVTYTFSNPTTVDKLDLIIDAQPVGYYSLATGSYEALYDPTDLAGFIVDMFFKPDGTKVYFTDSFDAVYQYSLSTAWDVSTASYDSKSFDFTSEDTTAYSSVISTDGTKMYLAGDANDSIFQYSLSTAWDISTASYDSVSFSTVSQDTSPMAVRFKDDGTKMYVLGYTNDTIYQYTLSTAWDISTASYDSVSFSTAPTHTVPLGISFSSDGTKMIVTGNGSDSVDSCTLSTAWDLSTASYDGGSLYVGNYEATPRACVFDADGSKVYVGGGVGKVYQFDTAEAPTLVFPSSVQKPTITLNAGKKTALQIVTTDGGTSYQVINVLNSIS